jgi:hypothetical protein
VRNLLCIPRTAGATFLTGEMCHRIQMRACTASSLVVHCVAGLGHRHGSQDLRDEGQKRKLAFSITGIWISGGKPTCTNQSCKDLNKALKLLLGALKAILGLFRALLGLSGESVDLFWCSLRVSENSFSALLDALGCPLDCLEPFGRWTLCGPSPDPAPTLAFDP